MALPTFDVGSVSRLFRALGDETLDYRIAPEHGDRCKQQLEGLAQGFAKQSVIRRDLEKLLRIRGGGSCE